MKPVLLAGTALIAAAASTAAVADPAPFTNIQPSLALTEVTPTGARGRLPHVHQRRSAREHGRFHL